MVTVLPAHEQLRILREQVEQLEADKENLEKQLADEKAKNAPAQPEEDWNSSGCTIDEDWELSSRHWGEGDWESSYC